MFSKDQLRIVFIGTPIFAVASLKAILREGFNVVAVITAPDRPAGRGLKTQESEVKRFSVENHIPVLQPTNLKSEEFLQTLAGYEADIQVVIAFRMLPERVWNMPRLGTFNLHASLLPAYRGAAPINRAIMNGETETGVSTFFLQHEIDTGPISFQEKTAIFLDENAGQLHDRLMELGANLVVKTLESVLDGTTPRLAQRNAEEYPVAPKLFRPDLALDPSWPAVKVHNHIRGLSPYPGAFANFNGKQMKVLASEIAEGKQLLETGAWEIVDRKELFWHCSDGVLKVLELQMEGKKRMPSVEFLKGLK